MASIPLVQSVGVFSPGFTNQWLLLFFSLLAGAGLGLFFFGGLWWTVSKLPTARQPALLTAGSLLLRLGITLAGLYWVMDGHWERLLAGLVGFLIARMILVRRLQPDAGRKPAVRLAEEEIT